MSALLNPDRVLEAIRVEYAARASFASETYEPAAALRSRLRRDAHRQHLATIAQHALEPDGQDRCREHFDCAPTDAEQRGLVLYADSVCSHCEEARHD